MLAGIERDLDLALYEPPSIRPDDRWIGVRRRAADELGALFGPLLLTADKDLRISAQLANRLRRLANNLDAVHEAPTSVTDGVVASVGGPEGRPCNRPNCPSTIQSSEGSTA